MFLDTWQMTVLFPCPVYEFWLELWGPSILSSFLSLGADQVSELQRRAALSFSDQGWNSQSTICFFCYPGTAGQDRVPTHLSCPSVGSLAFTPPVSRSNLNQSSALFPFREKKASKQDKFLSWQPNSTLSRQAESILSSSCHIVIQRMVTEACLPHSQRTYLVK